MLVVLFISLALCSLLAKLAPTLGLLAYPDELRQHSSPTPVVGGVAIFVAVLVGYLAAGEPVPAVLLVLGLICLVGVLDDRFSLPSWLRFVFQGLAAWLMIELSGVELHTLGSLLSSEEIHTGSWSTALTIFATIGVINALNMSDGLDGLAGSIALLALIAILFLGSAHAFLVMAFIAALIGFLFWNIRLFRAKAIIFMGDAGSTLLGLLLAFLLIDASQSPDNRLAAVSALWVMALPLWDAVAVLILRPLFGKSPFTADRIHYHHLLQSRGLSVNATLGVVVLIQSICIGTAFVLPRLEVTQAQQFYLFLGLFLVYAMLLFNFLKSVKQD